MLAIIKDREDQAKIKPVEVNQAEVRLKLKDENERRILKEEYIRK
jgi:hypothetical protein